MELQIYVRDTQKAITNQDNNENDDTINVNVTYKINPQKKNYNNYEENYLIDTSKNFINYLHFMKNNLNEIFTANKIKK